MDLSLCKKGICSKKVNIVTVSLSVRAIFLRFNPFAGFFICCTFIRPCPMEVFIQSILIFLHTLVSWLLVEWFFNRFHKLDRKAFIFWHYVVVFFAFFLVFVVFFALFATLSMYASALVAFLCVLVIEFIVFRLLYSGELWFFNLIDWVVPVGIAIFAVLLAGLLVT